MKSASLSHGSGPGSNITLTAETIRVRDAIIDKFADKSLAELNSFIETALGSESDENKRLGILAARIYILRMRVRNIAAFNADPNQNTLTELTPAQLRPKTGAAVDAMEAGDKSSTAEPFYQEWNELIVIEGGEINGVRIPKGVTINVGEDDARRLIETKKAVFANPQDAAPQDTLPMAADVEAATSQDVDSAESEAETETESAAGTEDQQTQLETANAAETGPDAPPPDSAAVVSEADSSETASPVPDAEPPDGVSAEVAGAADAASDSTGALAADTEAPADGPPETEKAQEHAAEISQDDSKPAS